MLSRLTPGVRAVVARAYGLAQRDGLQQIGEGHLLWALLDDEQGGVLLAKVVGASERAQVADSIDELVTQVTASAKPGDHIVCMSNGSFGGIHLKLLQALQNK